jgi:hypothetical protein
MRLIRKFILPTSIVVAISIGSSGMVYGGEENISANEHQQRIIRLAAVSDKVKLNTAMRKYGVAGDSEAFSDGKKKALKNYKSMLFTRVFGGELTAAEADRLLTEFAVKIGAEREKFNLDFKEALLSQAKDGKITKTRAEDIYNGFEDFHTAEFEARQGVFL